MMLDVKNIVFSWGGQGWVGVVSSPAYERKLVPCLIAIRQVCVKL